MLFKNLLLLFTIFFSSVSFAQEVEKKKGNGLTDHAGLTASILKVDSALFSAFNNCDSTLYKQFFTGDLEFYHDLGGLNIGLDKEMQSFRDMCNRGTHLRRELIKNSVEVYPIKDYGAVETGIHRFYHTNSGEQEKLSGTYKFVNVWQFKNNKWKLARVISYGHDGMSNK